MRRLIRYGIALWAYAFGISALQAQNTGTIKLEQAIELGIKNNSTLKLSDARVQLAGNHISQIKERLLPSARATASFSQYNLITPFSLQPEGAPKPVVTIGKGSFDAYIAGLSVNEDIFEGFNYRNSLQASRYLLEAAQLDNHKDASELTFAIISAYYNLYKIMKSQELIEQNIKLLNEKTRETLNFEKQGLVTGNEVLKFQLQQNNLELSRMEVENTKNTVLYNFKLMIGLSDSNAVGIDTTTLFNTPAAEGSFKEYEQKALGTRDELKSNAMKLKSSEYSLKSIKSSYYPHLGVGLGYNYVNPGLSFLPRSEQFLNAWNVGVNLSYNIGALYTSKGKLNEASINIQQLNDLNTQQSDAVKTEVFQSYEAYKLALQKTSVTQTAIGQASENYRILESKYRNSVALLSDLLEANTLLLQTRLNNISARIDAQIAYYKLLKSTGTLKK